MPETTRLHELLAVTAFGGVGLALALALLVAAFLAVAPADRRRLRMPGALLLMHTALLGVEALVPADPLLLRPLRVVAIALLLLSMARSGFLLVIHAIVGRRGNTPLPKIIQDILQGVFYAAVALVVLRAAGVEPGSLLTTSALLTAVIGLSLQDTLGNLFAGLAIQAQQPFEVGDWIQFGPEVTTVGRVVEINWRATRLVTHDQVELTVPNGALARASIANFSRPTPELRRAVTIPVSAAVPPGEVRRILLESLRGIPGVLEQPAPDVNAFGFTEFGIDYKVRYWTTEFDRREPIDGAVRERLWYAIQRAGLSLPSAQREVLLHTTTDATRAEERAQSTQQRARALRDVDFLLDLPPEAMLRLAATTQRRMYCTGEIVLVEGSEGAELFVVESGEVEIIVGNGKQGSARVATIGPGRFFGEMSLMTGEKRRATVRTLRETVLLVVSRRDLQPILEEYPAVAQRISEVLAEREVTLGQVQARSENERKSIVEQRSGALLVRIRQFFSL